MSERFAILNTETSSKKSRGERVHDNTKGNIFRQKPKTGRQVSKVNEESSRGNHKNHTNGRNGQSRNLFRDRQSRATIVKEVGFDIEKCNFPVLGGSKTAAKENVGEDSYMSKIDKTREKVEKEKQLSKILPHGWISLTKGTTTFDKIKSGSTESDHNPYYNPRGARLIMENRRKYREELNDILGDISPYWNMDIEFENDTEDYDDDDAYLNDTYDEEEEDYVEDW